MSPLRDRLERNASPHLCASPRLDALARLDTKRSRARARERCRESLDFRPDDSGCADLRLVEWFDLDTPDVNFTAGVVALDGKGATVEKAVEAAPLCLGGSTLGLCILDCRFTVDLEGDGLALHGDVVVEPLVVLVGRIVHDIAHSVEAARLLGVTLGGIDLGFESLFRPAVLLELGMKIESGVGALLGEDLEFDLEVLEVGLVDLAAVEEVGTGPFDDDLSIIHLPRVGGFIDGPSVEALPVEQFVEAILVLGLVMIGKGCAGQRERECDCAEQFHRGVVIGGGGKLGNPNRPGSRPGWLFAGSIA